jgi:hypothetical protein
MKSSFLGTDLAVQSDQIELTAVENRIHRVFHLTGGADSWRVDVGHADEHPPPTPRGDRGKQPDVVGRVHDHQVLFEVRRAEQDVVPGL